MNIRCLAADGTTSLALSPTELIEKLAALTQPVSIRKLLDALGLPSRAPPIAPPPYEQLELDAA